LAQSNEAGVVKGPRKSSIYLYFALIWNIGNIIFECHKEPVIVLFSGVKSADYGQELIAHHSEPEVGNDSNTACIDCDSRSNTISLS